MQQKPKFIFPVIFAAAFALAGTLASIAAAESVEPRILSLPDRTEAVLPGASDGENYGILVRRGSGFPEPEPELVVEPAPEEATEAPAQTRRIIIRRDRYGY